MKFWQTGPTIFVKKRLISKIYLIIFPFFKDLAVLYREKCIKGKHKFGRGTPDHQLKISYEIWFQGASFFFRKECYGH
jgi:hypothetical protein